MRCILTLKRKGSFTLMVLRIISLPPWAGSSSDKSE